MIRLYYRLRIVIRWLAIVTTNLPPQKKTTYQPINLIYVYGHLLISPGASISPLLVSSPKVLASSQGQEIFLIPQKKNGLTPILTLTRIPYPSPENSIILSNISKMCSPIFAAHTHLHLAKYCLPPSETSSCLFLILCSQNSRTRNLPT